MPNATGGGSRGRGVAFVLAAGTVTWCISEPLFWGRLTGTGNGPADALLTWTAYCAVVVMALAAVRHFRVGGAMSLVLVGALVGWLVEGVIVPEVAAGLPLSIAWTALAWHATLSVIGGWWLLPAVLRAGGARAWLVCGGLGLVFGTWSLDPTMDEDAATLTGARFVALAVGLLAVLALSYGVAWAATRDPIRAEGRPALVVVGTAIAAWAVVGTFTASPIAAPLVGALIALALWGLRRLRPPPGTPDLITARALGAPLRRTTPLVAAAAGATVANLGLDAVDLEPPSTMVGVAVLTPIGLALTARSLAAAWRAVRPLR